MTYRGNKQYELGKDGERQILSRSSLDASLKEISDPDVREMCRKIWDGLDMLTAAMKVMPDEIKSTHGDDVKIRDRARGDKTTLSRERRSQRYEEEKEPRKNVEEPIEVDEEPKKDDEELSKDDEELSKVDEEPNDMQEELCPDTNIVFSSDEGLAETKQVAVAPRLLSIHQVLLLPTEVSEDEYLENVADSRTNTFQEEENDANLSSSHHGSKVWDVGLKVRKLEARREV